MQNLEMKTKLMLLAMVIITSISCSDKSTDPSKWSDEEVNKWFGEKEWLQGWQVSPDASINKRNLAIHYLKNQRHWDQAFHFLKDADLKNLPLGKQELEGQHLFVSVAEYKPKQKSETRYESHQKYIDIQYVIAGKELMGITTADKVTVDEPYNAEKDLAFYKSEEGEFREATPGNFLVFFPDDIHRPSITTGDSTMVKKIVVKILIE